MRAKDLSFEEVLEKFATGAQHGDGLHYDLFERNYSSAVDSFRERLTDPDELARFDAAVKQHGIYRPAPPETPEEYRRDLLARFHSAPKKVSDAEPQVQILDVPSGAVLSLPGVRRITDLRLGERATVSAPDLESIDDNLMLSHGSSLTAPTLRSVGFMGFHSTFELGNGWYERQFSSRSKDGLDLSTLEISGATLTAPRLENIYADLIVRDAEIELPAVTRIYGSLNVQGSAEREAAVRLPAVTRIGTRVRYQVNEESSASLSTRSEAGNCSITTPILSGIDGSIAMNPGVTWQHPMTLRLAHQTDRLAEIPLDALVEQMSKVNDRGEILGYISELSACPFIPMAPVFMALSESDRLLAYLSCGQDRLSEEDTKLILDSLSVDTLADECLYDEFETEHGTDHELVDPRAEIRTRLAKEGRSHLLPAKLIEAERAVVERYEIDSNERSEPQAAADANEILKGLRTVLLEASQTSPTEAMTRLNYENPAVFAMIFRPAESAATVNCSPLAICDDNGIKLTTEGLGKVLELANSASSRSLANEVLALFDSQLPHVLCRTNELTLPHSNQSESKVQAVVRRLTSLDNGPEI